VRLKANGRSGVSGVGRLGWVGITTSVSEVVGLVVTDEQNLGLVRSTHQRRQSHVRAHSRLRTTIWRENYQHNVDVIVAPVITT